MEEKEIKIGKTQPCEGCQFETETCEKRYDVMGDPSNIDTTCYDY